MSYTITTNFDNRIPSWPGNGTPFTLIACHDTEGGQGRVGALGTIQFLIDRSDRGASYHEIWWYHEANDEFGVIRIVPVYRAAGSINPHVPPYEPTKWVKDSLGVNWWDPNQGVYAVSIAGHVADVNRYSQNPKFLAHAHRRMLELKKELGLTKRAEHFQFQPSTRSDWGKLLMSALGGYVTPDSLPVAQETSMIPLRYKAQAWTFVAGAKVYRDPSLTSEVIATLAGGPGVTIAEEAWQEDGAWRSGVWRLIVLGGDTAGWVHRTSMTPVSGDLFNNLVRSVLFETDLDHVPSWPPVAVDSDDAAEDAQIAALQTTVAQQTQVIADQKTSIADLTVKVNAAQKVAAAAETFKTALKNFLA